MPQLFFIQKQQRHIAIYKLKLPYHAIIHTYCRRFQSKARNMDVFHESLPFEETKKTRLFKGQCQDIY
jgi:hypothetical protein